MLFINCPLILCQANVADFGDNQWVTCFQESAETLLGQNSSYLGQLKDSVSFFFLPASHSYFFFFSFPCFPSVWYMKVWPWGLALRHWRAPHSVSIWSSFCGAFRIGIQAQGFLMRSYSERFIQSLRECSILRDKNCSFKMFCLLASCNIVLPCFYRTKLHLTRSFSMQTSILLSSGTEWSWRPTM